jgi:NADH-quinone oxidoreductase subunit A
MIEQFGYVAAFLGAGILFLGLILTLARFIRPNRPNIEKNSTYESGEAPVGNANIRFNPRFYVIALLFVLFEIELVFLFPTATLLKNKELSAAAPKFPIYAVVEILLFVGILALGLAFAWVKGYLNWEKPETSAEKLNIPIPDSVYDSIRTKHSAPKNVL